MFATFVDVIFWQIHMENIGNMFVVNFVLLTFRLLGMAPMTISKTQLSNHGNPKKKTWKIIVSWSWMGTMYNLGLIFGLVVKCYLLMPEILERDAMDKSPFSKMFKNTMIVCANAVLVILFITFCCYQGKLVVMGNKLIAIDIELNKLRIYKLNAGKTYIIAALAVNLGLAILFVRLAMDVMKIIGMTMIVYNSVIFSFYILQYALVVFVIESRFASLNQALLSLEVDTVIYNENNRSHIVQHRSVVVGILAIKWAYDRLYKLCSEISNFYAPLTIFNVIYFSTSLLYTLYALLIGSTQGRGGSKLPLVCELSWIFMRSLPFILLTTSVRRTHIQVSKYRQNYYYITIRAERPLNKNIGLEQSISRQNEMIFGQFLGI